MATFKFIHTSDLHLGRRFSTFPEDIRGRLVEARHGVLRRLIGAASERGVRHILVAGDLFDTETPNAHVSQQALDEMRAAAGVTWLVIPGNHDSLAGETLWEKVRDAGGVSVLTEPVPVELTPGVILLPAPVPNRSPGHDPTAWMKEADVPGDCIRIGLAHGSVQRFGEDGEEEVIPSDRATSAHLDYLALGDWHGCKRITRNTWYSGTPERDNFKHSGRGTCLAVTVEGASGTINVEEVVTGHFDWGKLQLDLTPEQNAGQALKALLQTEQGSRRDMLRKVKASGWLRLPAIHALERAEGELKPGFGHLELDSNELRVEYNLEDLDQISTGGVLREAANELYTAVNNTSLSTHDRRIASDALQRLYSIVADT